MGKSSRRVPHCHVECYLKLRIQCYSSDSVEQISGPLIALWRSYTFVEREYDKKCISQFFRHQPRTPLGSQPLVDANRNSTYGQTLLPDLIFERIMATTSAETECRNTDLFGALLKFVMQLTNIYVERSDRWSRTSIFGQWTPIIDQFPAQQSRFCRLPLTSSLDRSQIAHHFGKFKIATATCSYHSRSATSINQAKKSDFMHPVSKKHSAKKIVEIEENPDWN